MAVKQKRSADEATAGKENQKTGGVKYQKIAKFDEEKKGKKKFNNKNSDKKSDSKPFKRKAGEDKSNVKREKTEELVTGKELKKQRQMQKPHASLIQQAKQLWNELRVENATDEKRKEVMAEMMIIITGNIENIVFRHDSGRVIQCCLKYGNPQQRSVIINELQEKFVDMCKHTYSKFLVTKMLKYGKKEEKQMLISKFYGQVRVLLKHVVAAEVVQTAYIDHMNAKQKLCLIQELYGAEYALFKNEVMTIEKINALDSSKKKMVVKYLGENIMSFINKSTFTNAIVHQAIVNYLEIANENEKKELVGHLKEYIAPILHTDCGSQVGMYCIWNSTAKDRKVIIKSLKTYVLKIAKEEVGQKVLLAAFDSVDDTVLIKNIIISELIAGLDEIVNDKIARRVILYLLSHRSSAYFNKDFLKSLEGGDGNPNSKKDEKQRQQELVKAIQDPLNKYLSENIKELFTFGFPSQVIEQAALHTSGESKKTLLKAIADNCSGEDGFINDKISGMAVKRLLIRALNNQEDEDLIDFASQVWAVVKENVKDHLDHVQACYVICALLKLPHLQSEICDFFDAEISFENFEMERPSFKDPDVKVPTAQAAVKGDLEKCKNKNSSNSDKDNNKNDNKALAKTQKKKTNKSMGAVKENDAQSNKEKSEKTTKKKKTKPKQKN